MKKTTFTLMSCFILGLSSFTAASAATIVTVDNHYTVKWFGTANAYFRIYSGADKSNCTINGETSIYLHPYTTTDFNQCSTNPCKMTVDDSTVKGTPCEKQSSFYIKVSGASGLTWSDLYGPYKNGAACVIQKVNDKPGFVCQ